MHSSSRFFENSDCVLIMKAEYCLLIFQLTIHCMGLRLSKYLSHLQVNSPSLSHWESQLELKSDTNSWCL